MNPSHRSQRLERVRSAIAAERADWMVVPASADFRWLTGAVARSTERLVALALPRDGEPFCLVPRLEAESLAAECPWLELEIWNEGEDPFERLSGRMGLTRGPRVLIGEGMRVTPLLRLAARGRCRPAGPVLAPLRAVKDPEELAAMERASAHADQVVEAIADSLRPGLSELELARLALDHFEALGDREPWAIVASGPHSALPHHFSSARQLEEDDVVMLDMGAFTDGYGSDITRTFWLGSPESEVARVYEIVDQARAAGVAASRDGESPERVDQAARAVISDAGYGEFFIHRTGHGVGLEVHEAPYLVAGNRDPLRAGMVHSVEPGVYLPGRFGIRLEDLVVVENGGARRLNRAPRDPRPPRLRS